MRYLADSRQAPEPRALPAGCEPAGTEDPHRSAGRGTHVAGPTHRLSLWRPWFVLPPESRWRSEWFAWAGSRVSGIVANAASGIARPLERTGRHFRRRLHLDRDSIRSAKTSPTFRRTAKGQGRNGLRREQQGCEAIQP